MRIAFLCKRRYMGKDVIGDRYARLYEFPRQLALQGHEVLGICLDYHGSAPGTWKHEALPGSLAWEAAALRPLPVCTLAGHPFRVLRRLRAFRPDVVVGASDIPHVVLARWVARRLDLPWAADLYDNFEGFGQARIPGAVAALRHAVRGAGLVTTTSEPLRDLVIDGYRARGEVLTLPSSVDLAVFSPGDRAAARARLGLPGNVQLVGTAGGLYREKGIDALLAAWATLQADPRVHLVLAGPMGPGLVLPAGDRVHYLGHRAHAEVADIFRALDVGVISVLDTPFGRYCFPQKAYEMLACGLPVAAADVGAMHDLFAATPARLFPAGDGAGLAAAVAAQLAAPVPADVHVPDWRELMTPVGEALQRMVAAAPRTVQALSSR